MDNRRGKDVGGRMILNGSNTQKIGKVALMFINGMVSMVILIVTTTGCTREVEPEDVHITWESKNNSNDYQSSQERSPSQE